MAELLGGECIEISFSRDNFYAYATTSCLDSPLYIECMRATAIAGTFVAGGIALLLRVISRKKNYLHLYLASSVYFIAQLLYWGVSPLINYGDAHTLLQTTDINPISFSVIFLIVFIYTFIKTIIGVIKIWDLEMVLKEYGKN